MQKRMKQARPGTRPDHDVVTAEHKQQNSTAAQSALAAAINEQVRTELAQQVLEFGGLVAENCESVGEDELPIHAVTLASGPVAPMTAEHEPRQQLAAKKGKLALKVHGYMMDDYEEVFVDLHDQKLQWRHDARQVHVNDGVLNFDIFDHQLNASTEDACEFQVHMVGHDHILEFKALTAEDAVSWIFEIRKHIEKSGGHVLKKTARGIEGAWKCDNMTESTFLREAQTGDVLLFRGSRAATLLTRTVTFSEFDHVGIILRLDGQDDVFYLEATGGPGVSVGRWESLKKAVGHGLFYERIVYRHVNYDSAGPVLDKFLAFARQARGHKYGISAGGLMRQKTTKMDRNSEKFIEDDRTFFCSELVAKAFKILGVMVDDDISCTQFYPHHFTALGDSALNLSDGAWLEDEIQIVPDHQCLAPQELARVIADEAAAKAKAEAEAAADGDKANTQVVEEQVKENNDKAEDEESVKSVADY